MCAGTTVVLFCSSACFPDGSVVSRRRKPSACALFQEDGDGCADASEDRYLVVQGEMTVLRATAPGDPLVALAFREIEARSTSLNRTHWASLLSAAYAKLDDARLCEFAWAQSMFPACATAAFASITRLFGAYSAM